MDALSQLAAFVASVSFIGLIYGAMFYVDHRLNRSSKKNVAKKLQDSSRPNLTSIKTIRENKKSRKKK